MLDCGTGSGALLLAVLANLPQARGVGMDSSPGALATAKANAQALGLADRARMVAADWLRSDWAKALGGPFDLVLANPPYVETTVELDRSVASYEPASALYSGELGLDDYRILIPQLPGLLAPAASPSWRSVMNRPNPSPRSASLPASPAVSTATSVIVRECWSFQQPRKFSLESPSGMPKDYGEPVHGWNFPCGRFASITADSRGRKRLDRATVEFTALGGDP